jgi:hypothetical protein
MFHLLQELFGLALLDDHLDPAFSKPSSPLAVKVPMNITFLGLLADIDEAAGPGQLGPNLLTFRLPWASAWAMPKKATSRPPPS